MKSKILSFLQCFINCFILFAYIQGTYANVVPQPKIIIVGAGPAGLAAGTKLLEYGFKDFKIFEAEPRIGGRIHTIPFADNVVDLGAQWCHGQKNNAVYEMVHNLNLLESSAAKLKDSKLTRSNGEQVEESVQQRLHEIVENLKENLDDFDNENKTALDFLKTEFFKTIEKPENKHIDKTIAKEFFENFVNGESCYESADSIAELPARGEPDYEDCEGDQLLNWKDKGYKQFLNILLKSEDITKEFGVLQNHLVLSKNVKHIEWQRDDLKVRILCEDGEEILADHVILTVSLGVLKARHMELFEPPLPLQKQKSIENIDFGSVNKIFIEFDKPFWPDDWTGFSLLWRDEDLKEIRGTEKAWLEGIFGFHVVNYQPRLLEGWMLGTFGRHMETLPLETVKNDTLALLKRSLASHLSSVRNFTITTWFTNPNFRGTYSYHSINMKRSGVKPYDLEIPLNVSSTKLTCNRDPGNICERPVVLFAGEATNTKHYSTVHGAVESGWREAKRLSDYYAANIMPITHN